MPTTTDSNCPASILGNLIAPPNAIPGYETCWGFLARTEPATLSVMLDPVAGLASDELKARRLAKTMHVPFAVLTAPAHLTAAEGLAEIGAYPTALLELVFPVSP